MIWRDIIETFRFVLDLRRRWNTAAWEARLAESEKALEAKEKRLARLQEIEVFDSQHMQSRVRCSIDRVDCYWERRDLLRTGLTLLLSNWSIWDVVVNHVGGEVIRGDGGKIGDLTPKLDAVAIEHQSQHQFEFDLLWHLSDHDQEVLRGGNRRFGVKVRPSIHFAVADVGEFTLQQEMYSYLDLPTPPV